MKHFFLFLLTNVYIHQTIYGLEKSIRATQLQQSIENRIHDSAQKICSQLQQKNTIKYERFDILTPGYSILDIMRQHTGIPTILYNLQLSENSTQEIKNIIYQNLVEGSSEPVKIYAWTGKDPQAAFAYYSPDNCKIFCGDRNGAYLGTYSQNAWTFIPCKNFTLTNPYDQLHVSWSEDQRYIYLHAINRQERSTDSLCISTESGTIDRLFFEYFIQDVRWQSGKLGIWYIDQGSLMLLYFNPTTQEYEEPRKEFELSSILQTESLHSSIVCVSNDGLQILIAHPTNGTCTYINRSTSTVVTHTYYNDPIQMEHMTLDPSTTYAIIYARISEKESKQMVIIMDMATGVIIYSYQHPQEDTKIVQSQWCNDTTLAILQKQVLHMLTLDQLYNTRIKLESSPSRELKNSDDTIPHVQPAWYYRILRKKPVIAITSLAAAIALFYTSHRIRTS